MRWRMGLAVAGVLSLSLGLVGPLPVAHAATITVNSSGDDNPADANDGDCTLREAIDAANSDAAEDGCPAGSGADLIALPADTYALSVAGASENLGQTGDLDIRSSITIQGAGPATTTVNANGIDRAFDIMSPGPLPSVEISGVTIRGGDAETQGDGGGAIFNRESASLTLINVGLTQNDALYGGGIANDGTGSLTVIDSLVAGNTALGDVGGGFDIDEGVEATLTNVTVTGNSAGEGGGLWVRALPDASATLNNVTVTNNTAIEAGDGGGLHKSGAATSVVLRNTIVAGNSNSVGSPDCDGAITSQGHNIIGNDTGCTFTSATGDQVGTAASPIDPKLGPLTDNGGLSMTHALLAGSPAIDAGDPATPGSGGTACAATDQRGVPRNCDIGAYELILCGTVAVNRIGTDGNDALTGTSGADGFLALSGNDSVTALEGDDAVCSGDGKDRAAGGDGKDLLLGEKGKDTLKGNKGKDRLKGGPGKDVCRGGAGRDRASKCETVKKIP